MKVKLKDNFFDLIKDFFSIYLLNQKKLSSYTVSSYRNTMNQLISFICSHLNIDILEIGFETVTYNVIDDFVKYLEKRGNSDVTINQRLSAIRSFYKYASSIDITKVIYRNEINKVPLRKINSNRKKLKYLQMDQIKLLLQMPETNTKKGIRDLLMMTLLYDGALRVGELKKIRTGDIQDNIGKAYITVKGKGNKYRNVPISDKSIKILKKYNEMHDNIMDESQNLLFYTVIHGQKNEMSDDNINVIIKKYAKKANELDNKMPVSVHAHMLRHSRAMHLYHGGMPLELISQWLGHEQLETTLIYAYADTEMKRKAIKKAELIEEKEDDNEFELLKDENREEIIKKLYGLK